MNIRTKTKRRVAILASIIGVLTITAVAGVIVRKQQIETEMSALRAGGVAAAKSGDFFEALPQLSRYVTHNQEDAEALYYYSLSRRRIEDPQNKHINEPIGLFRQVLRLDPEHAEARLELLELYRIKRWDVEAIELADQILAKDAASVQALLVKGQSLEHQNKFDEAMQAAAKAVQLAPTNLEVHALVLSIMARQDRPAPEMIDYAQKQLQAHPEDPQSELLVAIAYSLSREVQDRQQALDQLREVAKRQPPNDFFVRALVHQLDSAGAFNDSLAVLEKHAPSAKEMFLRRLLARRLLEMGRYDRLIELFESVNPEDKLAHTELLGAKAYALLAGRNAQSIAAAEPYLDALDRRDSDPVARGWWLFLHEATLPLLRAAIGGSASAKAPPSPTRQMQVLQQALSADANNPFVHYRLGEVYAAMGEAELALTQWQRVAGTLYSAGLSTSWSTPLARMSQLYNATGRPVQAFECAFAALRRHREDALANLTLIESLVSVRRMGLEPQIQGMVAAANLTLTPLEYVERIQAAAPGEEQTLPLFVDLLAEAGRREDAIAAVSEAVAKPRVTLSEQTLLRLIAVDDRHDLGLANKLLEVSEKAHGVTPQLAATRAAHMAAAGKRDEALQYMQSTMARHGADELNWQLAHAQFLDSTNHSDAARAWAALGEKYADEARVQRHMLTVRAVQSDPALMRQSIDRLRQVSGDDGITWKLAHARWLLTPRADAASGVVAVSSASARDAIGLLNELTTASPDLIDARLLLATAHQSVGNVVPAIDNLNAVLALQPQRTDVMMQLARLRTANGDYEQAAQVLARATRQPLAPVQTRQAALMHAQMGRVNSAMELLEASGEPDLTLAELYLRRYDPSDPQAGAAYLKKAESIYQQLMAAAPNREAIASYAAFLAATGRREEAMQALSRLGDLQLEPGERELTLAEFKLRYVGMAEAAEDYRRATEAAPANVALWRERIEHLLSAAQVDLALATNAEALRHNPDNELFKLIAARADAIRAVSSSTADATGLVSAMLNDADQRAAAAEALAILNEAHRANQAAPKPGAQPAVTTGEVAQKLRQLADRHPTFLALNRLVMQLYFSANRDADALAIARRTAEKLPGNAAAQSLLVDAHLAPRANEASAAKARRYEETLEVARRVAEKFPTDAAAAERVARILAAQNRWNDVISAATAWRERSLNSPMPADLLLAEAHLNLGRTAEAMARLKPYTLAAAQNPQALFSVISLQVQAMLQESARQAAADQDQTIERAANLLKPHLAGADSRWRTLWMTLAARSVANPQLSAAWLQRVEPVIPDEAQSERMALAGSWFSLSRRTGSDEHRREALRVAATLAESAKANADVIVAYGILAYQCGDVETAANQYRRALKADPTQYQAQNNLAILLADQAVALRAKSGPESQVRRLLDEALDLAQQAASRNQTAATYYDTLAHISLARREYDKAISNLARAVELEPYQADWRVNLASAYLDSAEALAEGAGGKPVQEALAGADRVLAEMDQRRIDLAGRPDLQQRREKILSRMQQLRDASASLTP